MQTALADERLCGLGVGGAEAFIERWRGSGGAERANYAIFLTGLCEIIGVDGPRPAPSDYSLEYPVTFRHPEGTSSTGRIDLYKKDCFVLEAKQSTDAKLAEQLPLFGAEAAGSAARGGTVRGTDRWVMAMQRARAQAEGYAKALPTAHGWPPFLIVADIGHEIQLFADFSRTGKNYSQFPDAQRFRIRLDDLRRDEVRKLLHGIWTEPMALDPSRRSAKVTKEIAAHLAQLARSLELRCKDAEHVAQFLMRCLFTMFAQNVRLIPEGSFTRLLEELASTRRPDKFKPQVEQLWQAMNAGGFAHAIEEFVPAFNGGLFADNSALDLEIEEIGVLLEAARYDWREVEPAIFGTLLERALDPRERHKLGAHFTPRAYVERLVMPTIIEPLREDWAAAQASALLLAAQEKRVEALAEVRRFHEKLCATRVLDPACGTGNFLYVAMELMKRLEGEVIELARDLGEDQYFLELDRHTVDPHQFLGIEVNPRAAAIAELVLWIGYLQWHFRTRGEVIPGRPVLKNFKNIAAKKDAILGCKTKELSRGPDGKPSTRWDGYSFKPQPGTGRAIPDESAQEPLYRYIEPRAVSWPEADFIVGNPPFQGGKDLRNVLSDSYAEALWAINPEMPRSADLVMFWWDRAARLARHGKLRRFGLITTNSLPQVFNRRVVERHLADTKLPLSLIFAIPDHPWVDEAGSANVRIAMTVGEAGNREGRLVEVENCQRRGGDRLLPAQIGKIMANLRLGADLAAAKPLLANDGLSSPGVKLHGSGFIVTEEEAAWLGLGQIAGLERCIKPYRNGRDLAATPRGVMVIDLFGLTEQDVLRRFPKVYQWLLDRVRPERESRSLRSPTSDSLEYARQWWLFGKPRGDLRRALSALNRYIATVETSKHRVFTFLDTELMPDNKLICIAHDDAYYIGILSSRVHVGWAIAAGGKLGVGNDPVYVKTDCFDPFPFPACDESLKARIRELGEELDAFRKARQAEYPDLTITGMYNVLEKLNVGVALDAKEKVIHERGLVSVLLDLHRRLDAAVADAYGWPADLPAAAILERLVALNRERAEEEKRGLVRWLRPEYQAPKARAAQPVQEEMAVGEAVRVLGTAAWPKALPDQFQALTRLLDVTAQPIELRQATKRFKGAKTERVEELLQTLVALGQARALPGRRYGR
jgi:SAM-dependent methyltransferase